MYVDSLHVSPFKQPSAGHMALPSGTKWQCHNTCGPACMVDMKVIPQFPFKTYFDIFCNVLHTGMAEGALVAQVIVTRGAFWAR